MKQVVSNTTPIRYLAEINADYLLPVLFSQVLIPNAVLSELTHPRSPQQVKDLIDSNPDWLKIRSVQIMDDELCILDPGEREAIVLAEASQTPVVLIDEKMARSLAKQRGLNCIGTLRILAEGAKQQQINFFEAIDRLKQTTFRVNPRLLNSVSNSIAGEMA
ncbi:MAG: DUF3368 domain-containing protein [Prochlorotrichaceae cyanobacterium]|jgi:predicted nucleic acid-binding protein